MKKITLLFATFAMVLAFTTAVYAAGTYSSAWVKDGKGIWHAKGPDGNYIKNAWFCDDAITENGQNVWYLIDGNGCMITAGLVKDGTGNYYSIETNICGYYGMLRYKNGYYNCNGRNVYLQFEQAHNGSFGAIKNPEGLEALKQIYGVTDVSYIDNSNAVHSAGYAGEAASAKQDDSVRTVIERFKNEHIKPGMTDFEKEMQIIQWMVANIDYDFNNYLTGKVPQDSYSAYGALVKHVAVCDGYAESFKLLGEACGLKIEKISGEGYGYNGWGNHAWNQIMLDGEWYNVDVAWEDPVPSNKYGFGSLRNEYINCSDKNFPEHRTSDTNRHICTATKYGHDAVEKYLKSAK